jgi:hypothetical protein
MGLERRIGQGKEGQAGEGKFPHYNKQSIASSFQAAQQVERITLYREAVSLQTQTRSHVMKMTSFNNKTSNIPSHQS